MRTYDKPSTPKLAQVWQIWLEGLRELVSTWDVAPSRLNETLVASQVNEISRHPGFFAVQSEPEARTLALAGYPDGARAVKELAAQLALTLPPPASRRRVTRWRDEGDEYSHERAARGLEPWRSSARRLRRAVGLVELVSDWGGGCRMEVEALRWNGALVLALSELLEQADYATEVALVVGVQDGAGMGYSGMQNPTYSVLRVNLKRAGEPLVLDTLGAIVHPALWRVYGLRALALSPVQVGSGYNQHPHIRMFEGFPPYAPRFEARGIFGWRPDVLTLRLPQVLGRSTAEVVARETLKLVQAYVSGAR